MANARGEPQMGRAWVECVGRRMKNFVIATAALFLIPALARAAEPLWLTLPAPRPLPRPNVSGYAAHDGARIYYATFGSGPPVILLHGGLANSRYWGDQVGP